MSWASNNGWEDSPGGVISGETSFAHAGSIIDYQSGYVFVTHFELCLLAIKDSEEMRLDCSMVNLCLKRFSDFHLPISIFLRSVWCAYYLYTSILLCSHPQVKCVYMCNVLLSIVAFVMRTFSSMCNCKLPFYKDGMNLRC